MVGVKLSVLMRICPLVFLILGEKLQRSVVKISSWIPVCKLLEDGLDWLLKLIKS